MADRELMLFGTQQIGDDGHLQVGGCDTVELSDEFGTPLSTINTSVYLLGKLAATLCETVGLQRAAERSGLADSMKQVGIQRTVPSIVGLMLFWLLMCVAVMASFRVLGLADVSLAMEGVVTFIPKILIAMMVVVIGLLVASFKADDPVDALRGGLDQVDELRGRLRIERTETVLDQLEEKTT